MKALCFIATSALAVKFDDTWAQSVEDLNVNEYTKDTPTDYTDKPAAKPDQRRMQALVE